ncbi:MAG: EamA family transporter, partial [Microbacteriaceae bacterium]|nr:EamA family transporter [Microbacteriaceae bacterium]
MGYVFALAAALLFGTNGSVTKVIIGAGLEPAQLTLFRVAGTSIIAALVLLFSNRKAFRVTPRQFALLAVLGIFGVALLQYTYAVAIGVLPVGITLLIEYTAVLVVALFAFFFFKEKVR